MMNSSRFGSRRGIGTVLKVVIAAVVIVVVVAAFAETNGFGTGAVTKYFYTTSYARAETSVTVQAVLPNGHQTGNATYAVGDQLELFVTESSPANPLAVHMVLNNTVYRDWSWTAANGTSFTLQTPLQANNVGASQPCYVVVAFDDNNQAISNTLYITVHG